MFARRDGEENTSRVWEISLDSDQPDFTEFRILTADSYLVGQLDSWR